MQLGHLLLSLFCVLFFIGISRPVRAACLAYNDRISILTEIVGLIGERNTLMQSRENAILRSVLNTNIENRLSQYKDAFGEELDPSDIETHLENYREESRKKTLQSSEADIQKRQDENAHAAFNVVATIPVGRVTHLLPQNLNQKMPLLGTSFTTVSGSGLQWSADERFLLIRPIQAHANLAVLWDLKANAPHPLDAGTGWLSEKGNFFATNESGTETWVHDLDTGKKYGPFNGQTYGTTFNDSSEWAFNDHYVLLESKEKSIDSVGRTMISLVDYKNNKTFVIGEKHSVHFTLSRDLSRVAVDKSRTVEVFDVSNGALLKTFPRDAESFDIGGESRGFIQLRDEGAEYFVRLSDFKKVKIPSTSSKSRLSGDESKVLIPGHHEKFILDLDTGILTSYGQVSFSVSEINDSVIFVNDADPYAIVVDFKTMVEKRVGKSIDRITTDGQWAKKSITGQGLVYYNFETGKEVLITGNRRIDFLKSYALVVGSKDEPTYINLTSDLVSGNGIGADNFRQIPVGYAGIEASPLGNYLVTYADREKTQVKVIKLNSNLVDQR